MNRSARRSEDQGSRTTDHGSRDRSNEQCTARQDTNRASAFTCELTPRSATYSGLALSSWYECSRIVDRLVRQVRRVRRGRLASRQAHAPSRPSRRKLTKTKQAGKTGRQNRQGSRVVEATSGGNGILRRTITACCGWWCMLPGSVFFFGRDRTAANGGRPSAGK